MYEGKLEFIKKEMLRFTDGRYERGGIQERLRHTEQWCGLLKVEPGFVFYIIVIYAILVGSESIKMVAKEFK